MTGCSAVGCCNRTEQGKCLKIFPKDPIQRALWASKLKRTNIQNPDKPWQPTERTFLCEEHFEPDQWDDPIKKKLKKDAVPTLFKHNNFTPPSKREPPPKRMKYNLKELEEKIYQKDAMISSLTDKLAEAQNLITSLQNETRDLKRKLNQTNNLLSRTKLSVHTVTKIFQHDQQQALQRKSMAFTRWSDKTIKDALGLRFSCGTSGYNHLLSLNYPFPSVRTLQRRLENLKFTNGILYEVLNFLKIKVCSFSEEEKKCVLLLDEMSITESIDYDVASNTYFGAATPPFNGKANSALVFMISGISSRWKQNIAYFFTNKDCIGEDLKKITEQIIKEVEDLGLKIICVTSDMCGFNQGMWKSFGIVCNRENVKCYISSPTKPDEKIYFMADPPHLLKNIRSSLLSNAYFIISESLKRKHLLPTNKVSAKDIEELCVMQENCDLKLAHKLTPQLLKVGHFDKMKVGPAYNILSRDTSSVLKFLSEESGDGLSTRLTTAWFIEHIHKWFELMTSRQPQLALSRLNNEEYAKAIEFLQEIIQLFKHMKIVQKCGKVYWKPIQTGVILSTEAVIQLQKSLLDDGSKFVLTSRFSQDAIENLFGVVRSKHVIPTALQFRNNLKLISVSQFLRKCHTGSYASDDSEFLSGFLESIRTKSQPQFHTVVLPSDWDKAQSTELSNLEENCLHNIAGYILCSLAKNTNLCANCICSIGSKEKLHEAYSQLTELREFKAGTLYYVKKDIFQVFLAMEKLFRKLKEQILTNDNCQDFLIQAFSRCQEVNSIELPTCHNVKYKLLKRFAVFRLKILATEKRYQGRKNKYTNMSSKSMGMRDLAKTV